MAEKQGQEEERGGGQGGSVGRVRERVWCREEAELGQNMGLVGKGKGSGEGGGWRHKRQR